jgi:hypothetical protein
MKIDNAFGMVCKYNNVKILGEKTNLTKKTRPTGERVPQRHCIKKKKKIKFDHVLIM